MSVLPTVGIVEGSEFQIPGGKIVLILCGLIASGKSTFAEALQQHYPEFRRCNQDDLGDRKLVEQLVRETLKQGRSVCVDRTNFNAAQRSYWIQIAREFPGTAVWVIVFDTSYEVCAERLQHRTSHPTIKNPEQGLSVLSRFAADFQHPAGWEGYERILYVRPSDHPSPVYSRSDITAVLTQIQNSPLITPDMHRGNSRSGASSFRGNSNRGHSRGDWRVPVTSRPYVHVPSRGRGSFFNAGPSMVRRDTNDPRSASYRGNSVGLHGASRGIVQYQSALSRNQDNSTEKVGQGTGTGQDPFIID